VKKVLDLLVDLRTNDGFDKSAERLYRGLCDIERELMDTVVLSN
jgi:hypothetical protein